MIFNVKELVDFIKEYTPCALVGCDSNSFEYVLTDSRKADAASAGKCAFIALSGENFDGHRFIEQVTDKGCRTVICSRLPEKTKDGVSYISVDDTLFAYGIVALYYRKQLNTVICAVTGSVGKTSTKEMIAHVMQSAFRVHKSEKNFNNEVGLPMTLLNMQKEHDFAVIEMGMRGLGQIKNLCTFALPDMAVITNIGVSHIEILGNRENILKAKLEIGACPSCKKIFLNADNDLLGNEALVIEELKRRGKEDLPDIVYYGTKENCIYRAENIAINDDNGYSYDCVSPKGVFRVNLKVYGKHNVLNAVAATAVAMENGISPDAVKNRLESYQGDGIRQNVVKVGNITLIEDTYNAGPESMDASLTVLSEIGEKNRKIAVLGDMLELGEKSDEMHLRIAREAAEKADCVIFTGECMNKAAETLNFRGKDIYCVENSEIAAKTALKITEPGDMILVKGSHGMHMEKVTESIRNRFA